MTNLRQKMPLLLLVFLSILSLRSCDPQGYFFHGYNPYRTSANTRDFAHNQQQINRANRSAYNYLTSLVTAPAATESPQRDSRHNRISREDAENAKFLGASNLEPDIDSPKTLGHLKRKHLRQRLRQHALTRCRYGPYGRDAAGGKTRQTTSPQAEGRFLLDFNVYNVYPNGPYGCGGLYGGGHNGGGLNGGGLFGGGLNGGGLFGGGLNGGGLYDSLGGDGGQQFDPVYPASSPFSDFLRLFVPGVLQNALAATARPPSPQQTLNDPSNSDGSTDEVHDLSDPTVDPDVDPNYNPQLPKRRRNRVYYDSAGAPPLTPGQLVGGVATTVNGIIQQLSGNVQPVYQSQYRRSRSYG